MKNQGSIIEPIDGFRSHLFWKQKSSPFQHVFDEFVIYEACCVLGGGFRVKGWSDETEGGAEGEGVS